ncbi:hypothetical protein LXG23DRAFT_39146 [Yarrowia lipolytica]|jgi:hypothetical protein|uniref:Calcium channel YVC1 n=1 Tax=Yarrowia lipolytica TaxID=4952 RepID=A0A1D8N3Z1_YARLL|nr:hypothetical protein YALI1_A06778g [Yarrowia lipolytica]KAB8281785.1 hypothetical protein BKA91DRAFT_139680 [Yarrowia lipolytica]KAE8170422.1 hypothetical protein BKA90DRAFT_140891 [Yarrowia lipolytica]KAJ8051439.1 hypothetical protein LXG23DRAFT_39146 [Yarrowia lipolytica]RMI97108.1 hypothetical protein BD777DRAFT_127719 [Yarrowia lipolytica]
MAETTPLLGRDDLGDATASQPLDLVPIYSLVLWVHDIITDRVETSLKYEQIKTPQIYAYLIKPIVEECMVTVGPCEEENRAETHLDSCDHDETISVGIIYSLLANQVQFLRESDTDGGVHGGVLETRAIVCEIVALKLLRELHEDDLIQALTYDFYPLATGKPFNVIPRYQRISALEMAIKAGAKHFLAHRIVVAVVQEIWDGSIMFQSSMDKLHRRKKPDNVFTQELVGYGRRGPGVKYCYEDASLFKLSRLRVPRYRHSIGIVTFAVLIVLYLGVLYQQHKQLGTLEVVFWLWSLGFVLEEIINFTDAGYTLYVISIWNIIDLIILVFLVSYFVVRVYALAVASPDAFYYWNARAFDLLATVAIFLFPRMFSVLDNYQYFSLMLIAVRKMTIDLVVSSVMIILFSAGFWVAFTMAFARDVFSAKKIAYDLMKILFGFTPTVWDSWKYYSVLGRVNLMFFLFVTHFVIITILVAVLSNTFAAVSTNAYEEVKFLFAVNTITMIKSESSSLFSYAPPLNLLEWVVRPLYYVLPLRQFLVLNRTIIKITHAPILWTIFFYECLHLRLSGEKALRRRQNEIIKHEIIKGQNFRKKGALNSSTAPSTNASSTANLNTQPSHDLRAVVPNPNKIRPKRSLFNKMAHKLRKPSKPEIKVSNDDLLDEVFKRPYKGTVRIKNNTGTVQMETLFDGQDDEEEENAVDGEIPLERTTSRVTYESGRRTHSMTSSSRWIPTRITGNRNTSGSTSGSTILPRNRLASANSSLMQQNLAISPSRTVNTALYHYDSDIRSQALKYQKRQQLLDKLKRKTSIDDVSLGSLDDDEEEEHADDDDDENDDILSDAQPDGELLDMTAMLVGRMDDLQESIQKIELLLGHFMER